MSATEAELGIDAFDFTRSELIRSLQSNIRFLWRKYALAEESKLSPAAGRLKENILARIEFIPDAASRKNGEAMPPASERFRSTGGLRA